MIASPNHSARGKSPVRLVVVHTAEGARTRQNLGQFFRGNVGASSHVGIDAGGIEQYVDYSRSAWTLLNGNPISDNAELCAFARWTREQWFSTSPVDGCANPKQILDNTAAWIRERCLARGIPIRKLTPDQVRAGQAGVIGHWDWTLAVEGDHTDPGRNFPWDYVIARAAGEEDDMPSLDEIGRRVRDVVRYEVLATAHEGDGAFVFDNRNIIDILRQIQADAQQITGLTAAVGQLAEVVATNRDDLTADELKQAVTDAIKDAVVKVDVNVTGQENPA